MSYNTIMSRHFYIRLKGIWMRQGMANNIGDTVVSKYPLIILVLHYPYRL